METDREQLQEQFDELYRKYREHDDAQRKRSALKVMTEAKRFAKTHRMLMPYIHACFSITNACQAIFEAEIGIDNAMEIIALVESEEKARKFQQDYDEDFYAYTVHWVSACAYDNLAVHTAHKCGYNSPVVHGAVDDGIHVCRRTGKLECVDCFREYAVRICLASGDYEMGEHHARLCATSASRDEHDRRFNGYRDLVSLYIPQGKLRAAFEALEASCGCIETYHDPTAARIDFYKYAELLHQLAGKEDELPAYLIAHGFSDGPPEIPSREEDADNYLVLTQIEAVRQAREGRFQEAAKTLAEMERFLLGCENLNAWFDFRVARVATLLMAREVGKNADTNAETDTNTETVSEAEIERLGEELRQRASKACHWSAILALDTMLDRRVPLNPLGIAFPIDIGPYAAPGTAPSSARLELVLPLVEKTQTAGEDAAAQETAAAEEEKTPLEREAEGWFAALEPLWLELSRYEAEQEERAEHSPGAEKPEPEPFPKAGELEALENEICAKILAFDPEKALGPEGQAVHEAEFLAMLRPLSRMRILSVPDRIKECWVWMERFSRHYPERGRPLSALSYNAHLFARQATAAGTHPESLGLPDARTQEQWIARAFELEPQRTGVATTAGLIFRAHENNREAQRYFTRACQLDRLNEFATISLAELYEEVERPKDALATIDLYCRAGGRHPGLLWKALQIAYDNEMPQQFLLYYQAFVETQQTFPGLEARRIWALYNTKSLAAIPGILDAMDALFDGPARDRLLVRALCLAESGESSWTEPFEAALALADRDDDGEGLVGTNFDPCMALWMYVAHVARLDPESAPRTAFERFLYERGLVPADLLYPDDSAAEPDDAGGDDAKPAPEQQLFGYFRCILRQPLDPDTTAYAGWVRIPPSDSAYMALWLVLANDADEAARLAVEAQGRCYPLAAEVMACEQVDNYYAPRAQVVVQGSRQPVMTMDGAQE